MIIRLFVYRTSVDVRHTFILLTTKVLSRVILGSDPNYDMIGQTPLWESIDSWITFSCVIFLIEFFLFMFLNDFCCD